jgi:hypothetical protein
MRSLKILNSKKRKIVDPDGGDGLLQYILDIILEYAEINSSNSLVEFGAHTGEGGVFLDFLIKQGYKAVLIEGDKDSYDGLSEQYKNNDKVICINKFVDDEGQNTLDKILKETDIDKAFDVLLIDVDSIDYQIWESLDEYSPLVVIIEFNETYGPYLERIHNKNVIKWATLMNASKENNHWSSSIAGSSINSINQLAKSKDYELLTCTRNNAFFIKKELFHFFHLEEVNIEKNSTIMTLNIANRLLTKTQLMKKILRFGPIKTFFMYRQQKRTGIIKKIRRLIKLFNTN